MPNFGRLIQARGENARIAKICAIGRAQVVQQNGIAPHFLYRAVNALETSGSAISVSAPPFNRPMVTKGRDKLNSTPLRGSGDNGNPDNLVRRKHLGSSFANSYPRRDGHPLDRSCGPIAYP